MYFKRIVLPVLLIIFAALPLGAATVSVLVIEAGLPAESAANQYSGLWESGLLDVFFDAGHIVSNAPVMRLEYFPQEVFPDEAQKDLDEAIEGGMDYIVIALLEYNVKNEGVQKPRNARLRVFKTEGCQLVYEMSHADAKVKPLKDEFDSIKTAAKKLLPRIK
jgi:hypothetical protein